MAPRKTSTKLAASKPPKLDGWQNLLTGLGDPTRDKRLSAVPVIAGLSYYDLRALYRGDDMAARIVDAIPDEMTREWLEVKVDDDKDATEAIASELERLHVRERVNQAEKWKRAYGGGGILLGVNDGTADLTLPLNEGAIESVDYLTAFEPLELQVIAYYTNPLEAKFGEPLLYRLNPRAMTGGFSIMRVVHESRIVRFNGPVISRDQVIFNQGWGDSALLRPHDTIRNFGLSWDSTAALIADFSQAVFKMTGLNEAIANDREGLIADRLRIMEISRSVMRAIAIDAEGGEDFERKPTPLTGLPEVLDRFMQRLAASANMPVSVLIGQKPAGLAQSGDGDARMWYDQIAARQESELTPQVRKIVRAIMRAKRGPMKGTEPAQWAIHWHPLWQLDEVQKATVRASMAQADQVYLSNGVVTVEEIAKSRFTADGFSVDTQLDGDLREKFARPDPEAGTVERGDPDLPETAAETEAKPAAPAHPLAAAGGTLAPGAMPAPAATGGDAKAQDTALNGAQVTSALEIVQAVVDEKLPRDSGVAMLISFFNLKPDDAEKVMGSVGKGFKPKEDPAPVVVAPGAKPPGAPAPAAAEPPVAPKPEEK